MGVCIILYNYILYIGYYIAYIYIERVIERQALVNFQKGWVKFQSARLAVEDFF